ncbi:phosphotransferase family protein [Saccharothrix deserti]|uniref:phosphotransferase family protein n=1 Tax=Saccharothrix deserti TaxID=2593674 RepID=UPI00131B2AA8|nr:phosphotransferase [Saccharothrix deserti]
MLVAPDAVVAGHGLPTGPVTIHVDRPGRLVARVGGFAVKVDERPDAFVRERAAIARLGAAGLPVSEVHASRDDAPSHLVLRWIEGEPLSMAGPPSVRREAGRLLRRVHAEPESRPDTIGEWMTDWTTWILAWLADFAGVPAQRCDEIRAWCRRLQPLMTGRGTLTLLDGRPDHFVVRDGRIAGLIDLEDVSAGDPAMDLAVLAVADEDLLPEVLEGYAPTRAEAAAFDELIPFYVLLRRLAAANWEHQHGNPARTPRLLEQVARTRISP